MEFASFLARHPHFESAADKCLCAAVVGRRTPTSFEFVRAVAHFLHQPSLPAPGRSGITRRVSLLESVDDAFVNQGVPAPDGDAPFSAGSRFFTSDQILSLSRLVLSLGFDAIRDSGMGVGEGADVRWPLLEGLPLPQASHLSATDPDSLMMLDAVSPRLGEVEDVVAMGDGLAVVPRIRHGGGEFQDALEEWDEADEEEDARAAARLAAEGLAEAEEEAPLVRPAPRRRLRRISPACPARQSLRSCRTCPL